MKTFFLYWLLPLLFFFLTFNTYSQYRSQKKDAPRLISEELKNLPLMFRGNAGQWDHQILYKGTSSKGDIYFLKNGLTFSHSRTSSSDPLDELKLEHFSWSLSFEGMNAFTKVEGKGEQASRTNYLTGSDVHRYNVPDYNQINYLDIYPNVDLRYYGAGADLKYDYILNPGASLSSIRMKCDGIDRLTINKKGELEIQHAWGVIKENAPYSYQIINGVKKEIDIRFELLNETTFGFKLHGGYDPTEPLVIDPVTLIWGTYVGGNNPSNGGYLYDLTTDEAGFIYATGYYPNTFPASSGAYDESFNGGYGDVFVFKLDTSGSYLHYATYIGGNDDDRGKSIAVNKAGEAFITGYTASASTSFPATKVHGGAIAGQNVFVCRLNASGSSLMYSAYIGGLNHDIANGIIVDPTTNVATVVGETQSSNFPTTATSFDPTYNGGSSDAFFLQLSADGNSLNYATFIGGAGDDRGRALQVGQSGVFVTGQTSSANFPTTPGAYDQSHNGDFDAFVTKINAGNLIYSTFLGGAAGDEGTSIDVNTIDEVFICGYSYSPNYPRTVGDPLKGLRDVILTRLDFFGSSVIYSRFIGGSKMDEGTSIIVNTKDQAFIAGTTESIDYPLVLNGIDDPDPTKDKELQVFVTMVNETGALIKKSIKIGGSFDDYKVPSLSFPNKKVICNIVVGFTSHSPDLKTTDKAYQKTKLNGNETNDQPAVFNLYFGPQKIPKDSSRFPVTYCPQEANDITTLCISSHIPYPNPYVFDPDYPMTYYWPSLKDSSDCINIKKKDADITGYYTDGCNFDDVPYYTSPYLPPVILEKIGDKLCKGKDVSLSVKLENNRLSPTYLWSTGSTSSSISVSSAGKYWVRVGNLCGSVSDTFYVSEIDIPVVDLGPNRSFCAPGSVELDAFHASHLDLKTSYKWSTNATSSSIIVTETGTYTVDVTNVCGTVSDAVTILRMEKPIVNLGKDSSICQNSTVTLDAGNPTLLKSWSTGSHGQTIVVSAPGIYWVDVTNVCGTTRDSIVIEKSVDVPVIDLGPDKMLCSNFMITLDATYGASNYYWSTGETTPAINVTSGGTYHVTVTNGCGIDQDTITITGSPSSLELGPEQFICSPATATFTATDPGGNATYKWSTGATTPSITVGVSGTYSVTVTNQCGTASDNVKLTMLNGAPAVNIGKDTSICPNTTFILNALSAGGAYVWSTGETTPTISISIAAKDTFWVDVTNACGITRDSILLDIAVPPVFSLGRDTAFCVPNFPSTPAPAMLLDAGNPGATYLWSTGATSRTITSNAGIYWVDITRCATIRDSIVISVDKKKPEISLGKDTTICDPFIQLLNPGGASDPANSFGSATKYLWLPDSLTTPTISVSIGKLYIVQASNACGTSYDSLNIIGKPYPNLGPDVAICVADTIELDAGNQASNPTYDWSTGESTPTIRVFKSGTYTVDVTNTCGKLTDEILISIDTIPCVVELGPDQRLCAPASITLDAENDGSLYLWSTGETTRTIMVTSSGKYKVEVTNGCGITPDSINILIDSAPPVVDLGPDKEACTPVNKLLDAGNPNAASYQWFPGNQSTQKITAVAGGTYSVKVTNACGSDSAGIEIKEFFHPVVDLGPDQKVCIADPDANPIVLDGTHPDANYFWIPGGQTTQTLAVTKTGTYGISASNICGIYTDEAYILIDTLTPGFYLGKDTNLCSPDGYMIDAGFHEGATYVWSPGGESTPSIVVKSGGTYSVTITNQCGPGSDVINIAPNPVTVDARPDTIICFRDTIQLSTPFSSGYTYSWTPAETLDLPFSATPKAWPSTSTKYILLASDGICTNVDTATVNIHPLLKPNIAAWPGDGYIPLSVSFHNEVPAPSHMWVLGDGDTARVRGFTHTFKEEGIYTVILMTISPQGCIEYDTAQIVAFDLFIPNLLTPNKDGLNDKFDLTNLNVHLNLEIYNRWGDLIYSKESYVDEWPEENTSEGIYYYHVFDTKYNKHFKGWVQVMKKTE